MQRAEAQINDSGPDPRGGPQGPLGGGGHHSGAGRFDAPGADPFGGAPGYFQGVLADGTAFGAAGGQARLPVTKNAVAIARSATGHRFFDQTVDGTHLRVYAFAGRAIMQSGDGTPPKIVPAAIEVARPLTEVDSVLHQLLFTFGAVILAGILLALAMGAAISRTALAPIGRFVNRTEAVSGALDRSERLEEGDTESSRGWRRASTAPSTRSSNRSRRSATWSPTRRTSCAPRSPRCAATSRSSSTAAGCRPRSAQASRRRSSPSSTS